MTYTKELKEIDMTATFDRAVIIGNVEYLQGEMIRVKIKKVYGINLYRVKKFKNCLAGWIPFTSKIEGFWEIDNTFKKELPDGIIEFSTAGGFRNPSITIQNYDERKWKRHTKSLNKLKKNGLIFSDFP